MLKKFDHVCITTLDMKKSVDFYENVLGLELVHFTDEWSELSLNSNANLAIYKTDKNREPGLGFVVEDCKKATEELKAKNIEIVKDCEKRNDGLIITHFKDNNDYVHWLVENTNKATR